MKSGFLHTRAGRPIARGRRLSPWLPGGKHGQVHRAGLVLIEVWFEMKTGGRYTLPIRVSDNAAGIPEDRLRAIPCLFQQGDEREMALVAWTTVHGFAGMAVNGQIPRNLADLADNRPRKAGFHI